MISQPSTYREFLQSHVVFLFLAGALEEAQGVKSKFARLASRSLEHLDDSNSGEDLRNTDPEKKLSHGARLDQSIVGGNGGKSFVGLGKRVHTQSRVDGNKANDGEHTHASVLQFGFTEEVNRDKVGEAEGVETNISNVSFKVRGVFQKGERRAGLVRGGWLGGWLSGWLSGGLGKLDSGTACKVQQNVSITLLLLQRFANG